MVVIVVVVVVVDVVVIVVVVVLVLVVVMLIMIVAFTGVATEIVVGSALAVMSFSAPRGRISSMEGSPYQGLDSVQATNRSAAQPPTDQRQPRAVI